MKVEINVSHRHIRCGTPGNYCFCPIVLAIQEVLPGWRVEAFGNFAVLNKRAVRLPVECAVFVGRFDNGLPVEPFSFLLDTEDEAPGWKFQ